jgi:hypothetical protein
MLMTRAKKIKDERLKVIVDYSLRSIKKVTSLVQLRGSTKLSQLQILTMCIIFVNMLCA